MAARRGKTQARRNTGSGGLPGWAWMLIGILLTLLAVAFAPRLLKSEGDGFFRPTPNPDAQPPAASTPAEDLPAPARGGDRKPATGGGEDTRRGSQYDFYTLLPGREVPVSDAELAATQRAEQERAALQAQAQQAGASEDAAELALPAPVDTSAPAPAAGTGNGADTNVAAARPASSAAPAATDSRYLLQAGAFEASGQAEELKARIALLGLSARVESARINDRTVYRVRMGPYGTAGDLAEARQKLADGGLDAMAIKVQ